MNCDIQFFLFSDYSYSPISTRFSDSFDCYYAIFPILLILHDSPIFPIIRFFWLLFSDFSDSVLLVLRDSPIFPIIRFFWLLFSNFSGSPSFTRFSYFSDYSSDCYSPIFPIIRFSLHKHSYFFIFLYKAFTVFIVRRGSKC